MTRKREISTTRGAGPPRQAATRLTRARILTVGLALVDDEGMDALSMRRLAAELGVDPMSLYYHLPRKAAIVSGLVELVFSEMGTPEEGGPWEDRVRAWAAAYRRLARRHPNLVLQIVSDAAAVSTAMLLVSESLYQALSDARLPPVSVVHAASTVVDFVNGFALAEGSQPPMDAEAPSIITRIQSEPGDRLPALRRVYEALADDAEQLDLDSGFDAGIDVIVAGITALADRPSRGQP